MKHCFRILLFIGLIINPFTVKADDIDHLIREANDLYSNNDFRTAINLYDSVLNSGYEAPEIYYNIGNSYFKLGQTTDAIINYERALLLAPDDEDINYNLSIANNQVLDNIDKLPELFINKWFKDLIGLMSVNAWAILSIICFILSLTFFCFFIFSGRHFIKKFTFWISIILLFFSINSFIYSGIQRKKYYQKKLCHYIYSCCYP